jgi:hypothetical protein
VLTVGCRDATGDRVGDLVGVVGDAVLPESPWIQAQINRREVWQLLVAAAIQSVPVDEALPSSAP